MILAPMQGLTEVLFRHVYEQCFPGAIAQAVSPFLSLTHNLQFSKGEARRSYLADVLPENNKGSIPLIPQILGKEAEEFVQLAQILYDLGYPEVNWNMGCPMRKVVGKHRGCGLMPYPDEVRALLDYIMPRIPGQLSIKLRLGLKERSEIERLIPILNDYPLANITLHPRLGRQQYGGVADRAAYGELLPLFKAPVIYNGDICTPEEAADIRKSYPKTADLMVGRGVLYRPTLPLEIADKAPMAVSDRITHAKRFVRCLMREITNSIPYQEAQVRKKKEYWSLLWKSLDISEQEAHRVLRASGIEAVDNLIEVFIQ